MKKRRWRHTPVPSNYIASKKNSKGKFSVTYIFRRWFVATWTRVLIYLEIGRYTSMWINQKFVEFNIISADRCVWFYLSSWVLMIRRTSKNSGRRWVRSFFLSFFFCVLTSHSRTFLFDTSLLRISRWITANIVVRLFRWWFERFRREYIEGFLVIDLEPMNSSRHTQWEKEMIRPFLINSVDTIRFLRSLKDHGMVHVDQILIHLYILILESERNTHRLHDIKSRPNCHPYFNIS